MTSKKQRVCDLKAVGLYRETRFSGRQVSMVPIVKLSSLRRLHLNFRAGGDDDDLPVGRPLFGVAIIFHVVERHCLVVPRDRVRWAVAVLITEMVNEIISGTIISIALCPPSMSLECIEWAICPVLYQSQTI